MSAVARIADALERIADRLEGKPGPGVHIKVDTNNLAPLNANDIKDYIRKHPGTPLAHAF